MLQIGSGETILTANSTYTGATNIDGGALAIDGSIISNVFVNAGGTLSGAGQVGPTTVNSGGIVSPGHSVGVLTVNGDLTFAAGSQYFVEIQDAAADLLNVSGTANLHGTLTAAFQGARLVPSYTVLDAAGGVTGAFERCRPWASRRSSPRPCPTAPAACNWISPSVLARSPRVYDQIKMAVGLRP